MESSSSQPMTAIQITCTPEQTEVAASAAQHQMLGLVHIQAPALVSDERASRAPIAVSAVIDRSGSMSGDKLKLVQKTMAFVIRNLKDDDQLGVVAYDDEVTENLPLIHMTAEGRKRATEAVEAICVGGCTNLSGGLFAGLDQLQGIPIQQQPSAAAARRGGYMQFQQNRMNSIKIRKTASPPRAAPSNNPGFFQSLVNSVSSVFGGTAAPATSSSSSSSANANANAAVAPPIVQQQQMQMPIQQQPMQMPVQQQQQMVLNAAPNDPMLLNNNCCNFPISSANDADATDTTTTEKPAVATAAPRAPPAAATTDVTSVWLFTDGLANAGIQNAQELKDEVQRRLTQMKKPCSVFTFGFGSDHDSAMLNGISEAGNGMYYFVETEDKIPDAFSDCLGGLLSVVAQNLKLTLRPEPGCTLVKVHTAYTHEMGDNQATVRLPDIYSEEARDIIVEFRLSTVPEPYSDPRPVVHCALDYFNVISSLPALTAADLRVARPASAQSQPVPAELDRQRNRIRCTEALKKAQEMAEAGQLEQAKCLLKENSVQIQASETGNDQRCQAMLTDLQECVDRMATEQEYRSCGRNVMMSHKSAHGYQRSCGTKNVCYQTSSKMMYQKKYHEEEED